MSSGYFPEVRADVLVPLVDDVRRRRMILVTTGVTRAVVVAMGASSSCRVR